MTDSERVPDLEVRLLGTLEVRRHGEPAALPRSKKTRALLAYLVASGREHGREALCSLLWETTDDPRGALRWSLSKLRRVVDDDVDRIVADRQRVAFLSEGVWIDAAELAAAVSQNLAQAPLDHLERVADRTRGEFLEALELPDLFEFQAWCIAERERTREARCELLSELVRRLRSEPKRALPYARARIRADPFSLSPRQELLELLLDAGKKDEAQQHFELGRRFFREMNVEGLSELERTWRSLSTDATHPSSKDQTPRDQVAEAERDELPPPRRVTELTQPLLLPFVGRSQERERLAALLEQVRSGGGQRIALVNGEPGSGKSRLAELMVAQAREFGVASLQGRAYEAESSRLFGPWVDALGTDIAELAHPPSEDQTTATRERLFAEVVRATTARATDDGCALLVLDDIQWLDRDSAELLHFVARSTRDRPLLVLLLARSGELSDNEPALRALRSLRRETGVETIDLQPLAPEEIGELVSSFAHADADQIHRACAGNPLYALELARAAAQEPGSTPSSLVQLVQERVDHLPPAAAEVLRWGAVLGHTVAVSRLRELSSLELNELMDALERLEQNALLSSSPGDTDDQYAFAHDVVRQAVYSSLSHPRRRLMHQQVARLLEPEMAEPATATEVARHASLAGEASLGVRACIAAGTRSLRGFANGEAEALALRGLKMVDELEESERIASTLELLHVQYSARAPDREEAATRVHDLATRALDLGLTTPARLGFQMLSFLRWESSSMADAHANIMQAERVSRTGNSGERAVALAQAARCLVLLERNMAQAEAFVLEAEALGKRETGETSAVKFAAAMIHEHRGERDEAAKAFREARWIGRQQGDRLAEFRAIEHWTMLEIDNRNADQAQLLATELASLGERVRQGAERPSGRALLALTRLLSGHKSDATAETVTSLETALEELRLVDAKYQLAFVMTRLAHLELENADGEAARGHAEAGLELAIAIGRASDVTLSRVLLARCAENAGDDSAHAEQIQALRELQGAELSVLARSWLDRVLSANKS